MRQITEREGFEPSISFQSYRRSRSTPSTTRTSFQLALFTPKFEKFGVKNSVVISKFLIFICFASLPKVAIKTSFYFIHPISKNTI